MQQRILHGPEARKALLAGITKTNNAVKVTLGPQGRNVMANHVHGPIWSSKDGIRVIREISLPDQAENGGVKLIREASAKTADSAGDATTTTCIIASELVTLANAAIDAGYSPVKLRKEIDASVAKSVEWIKKHAVAIKGDTKKVKQIATIAANNNDEIGELIAQAFDKTGADGTITLQASPTGETKIEVLGGYYFNKGMMHPYFITDAKKSEAVLAQPYVLIYDKIISKAQEILVPLEFAASQGRAILVLCSNIEGEALSTILINVRDRGLKACVVQCPEQGARRLAMMEDIATFTGGQVVGEDYGKHLTKEGFKPEYLGEAEQIIAGRDKTVIVSGQGNPDEIKRRSDTIKATMTEATSDHEKEFLRNRAAAIGKGVAVLHIGAPTDVELGDKIDLAEDAVLATRSALEEGFLPGGGISYLKIGNSLAKMEGNILAEALTAPYRQLLQNSDVKDDQDQYSKIIQSEANYGFNARTARYENLVKAGVIDAAKVVRNAIENAGSVAAAFISTEVFLVEEPDAK